MQGHKDRIIVSLGKNLGDIPVLVAEAISIHEPLKLATDHNMGKILIEGDSQIVINFIRGLIKVSSHVIDFVNLARNFGNIQFNYCNKFQNSFLDRFAKKSHPTCDVVCLYQ